MAGTPPSAGGTEEGSRAVSSCIGGESQRNANRIFCRTRNEDARDRFYFDKWTRVLHVFKAVDIHLYGRLRTRKDRIKITKYAISCYGVKSKENKGYSHIMWGR